MKPLTNADMQPPRSTALPPDTRNSTAIPFKRGHRSKIATTIAISSLVGLFIVELLVRLMGLDVPRVWEPDPVLGWHHIPGATRHFTEEGDGWIKVNSHGFRDLERSLTKPSGTFHIMALGDSMTEAVQVNADQTFCHALEQRLNLKNRPVEVLNCGVNGYSPAQELLLLQREGPRYRPDLVIVGLFLDNDVSGCHPQLSTTAHQSPFAKFDGGKLVFDYSRAESNYREYHRQPIHLIRASTATYRWFRTMSERRAGAEPVNTIATRHLLYAVPNPPVWDEAWSVLEQVLLEIAAETERFGARLLIVSLPCAQAVDEKCWEAIQQQQPVMKELAWELEGPERRLKAIAERHGMLLFQPLAAFREKAPEQKLFFGIVGHMNSHGHQLTGDLIAEFVDEQRILPDNGSQPNGVRDEQAAIRH